jgi:hypothetical protein
MSGTVFTSWRTTGHEVLEAAHLDGQDDAEKISPQLPWREVGSTSNRWATVYMEERFESLTIVVGKFPTGVDVAGGS